MEKQNLILKKSFQFALNVIDFAEQLNVNKKYLLSNQLFRAGTSIGANIREAQHAESPADFIHKLKISAKEAEETEYWLSLCKESAHYPSNDKLIADLKEIQKILTKIIYTTKNKL